MLTVNHPHMLVLCHSCDDDDDDVQKRFSGNVLFFHSIS